MNNILCLSTAGIIYFQVHVSLSELFVIMSMMFVSRTTNFEHAIDPIGQERYSNMKLIKIRFRFKMTLNCV